MPQDRALARERGQPLCMAQYQRLFATYRTPGVEKDELKTLPAPGDNEHVIVAHRGQVRRYSSAAVFCSSKVQLYVTFLCMTFLSN